MTNNYFGGTVSKNVNYTELDKEVIDYLNSMVSDVDEKIDALNMPGALAAIFDRLGRLNKYIDENTPWALAKDEAQKGRLNDVLYTILEGIRMCAIELECAIPSTSKRIYEQLNTPDAGFENITFGYTESFKVVEKPEILFARIDETALKAKLEAEEKAAAQAAMQYKPEVTIEDFEKMDLRVGTVVDCKKHPKADKLLVFTIQCGSDTRQIVSGIAKWYKPEQLVGKKVAFIANLKPVTLRGVESQGMILSAEDEEGNLEVVSLADVADGASIK